jgi:hypothetical protein
MANTEALRRKATATRRGELSVGEQDDRYFRRDATSLPTVDNTYNIGSASFKLLNIFSTTFTGRATSASYADLAEMYRSDRQLEAGDVVILGGSEEITLCEEMLSAEVLGVVSTAPGFLMNSEANSSEYFPIVMSGRAPCKVKGIVFKGDRLVASDEPGYAVAVAKDATTFLSPFCVIGRALEDKDSEGFGIVEAVLGKL